MYRKSEFSKKVNFFGSFFQKAISEAFPENKKKQKTVGTNFM